MTVAPVEEVLAALERVDLDRPWQAVAHQVLPVLPRRRPFPRDATAPVTRHWPNGLHCAFGLDIGPAFLYVGEWALGHWGLAVDELAERAIINVRERAAGFRPEDLVRDAIAGMPFTAFQSGDGWASAVLLVPEVLVRILGPEPCLVLAPMRDLVVQLPADADPDLAAWLLDEFAGLDPNGLAVPPLTLRDGEVAILRRGRRPGPGSAGPVH